MPYFPNASSGGAAAATPQSVHSTMFENSTRFLTSVSGSGAVTFDSQGAKIALGTTGLSQAILFDIRPLPEVSSSIFTYNPSFWFDISSITPNVGDWEGYVIFGLGSGAYPTTSGTYFGIKYVTVAGTTTIYSVTCNSSAETLTAISSGLEGGGNPVQIFAKATAGTDVKFYANHLLVATHTTNLPTNFSNGRWTAAANRSSSTNNQGFYLRGLGYSYAAI